MSFAVPGDWSNRITVFSCIVTVERCGVCCSVLLNVMYTMTETLRWPNENDSDERKRLRENFRADLCTLSCFVIFCYFTIAASVQYEMKASVYNHKCLMQLGPCRNILSWFGDSPRGHVVLVGGSRSLMGRGTFEGDMYRHFCTMLLHHLEHGVTNSTQQGHHPAAMRPFAKSLWVLVQYILLVF